MSDDQQPVRYVAGHVVMTSQMLDQLRSAEAEWADLEWIARHYDEATAEQRARLDRTLAAIDAMEDE